jgi:uncharacterized protein YukE
VVAVASITLSELKVDLDDLEGAIGIVQTHADIINDSCSNIAAALHSVPGDWITPAGNIFDSVTQMCTTQMNTLTGLLGEMVQRMRTSHQNYLNMEQANVKNLENLDLVKRTSAGQGRVKRTSAGQGRVKRTNTGQREVRSTTSDQGQVMRTTSDQPLVMRTEETP